MAHPSEIDRQITLELEPYGGKEGIPIDTFRQATDHFTKLLRYLTDFQGKQDKWLIHAKPGCLLIGGQYCGDDVSEEDLIKPLQVLENEMHKANEWDRVETSIEESFDRTSYPPLTQRPITANFRLYNILGAKISKELKLIGGIKGCHISLWINKTPYQLNGRSYLFEAPPEDVYTSKESVRGTLVNISSKSKKCQITIYSPAFDLNIKGKFEETSKLMTKAKNLLGKFVEVSGLITYEDVYPKEIEVSDISDLATSPEEQLRVIREAGGILKGYVSPDELE